VTKRQLELMLREAGILARESDFFLLGSQSLRAVCSRYPKGFPKTLEADLYPRHHAQAWNLLREKMGRHSSFRRQHGVFLECVDPGLATLPDGWMERLIPFRTRRTAGVTAWCLEPNDLFVAKIAAWRPKDQQFLRAMLRHKFAKPSIVLKRIKELPVPQSQLHEMEKTTLDLLAELRREERANRS